MPLKCPDLELSTLLEQHADRLLAQLPQQQEIVEQVRKAIARHLREAGTGFRAELNLVRHELALSYLRDPRL